MTREEREALRKLAEAIERLAAAEGVVQRMAEHLIGCERFDGAIGNQRFVGCRLFNSDDPDEYCFGCEATAYLAACDKATGGAVAGGEPSPEKAAK